MKPILGIAGSIGAGKTAVARILEARGAVTIDSDKLAHEVLQTDEVIAILTRWWGEGIRDADGKIDRSAVARIVFDQPDQLKRLEDLLYPIMADRREEQVERYVADPNVRAIILDSPKLFEAGLNARCDAVLFVDAPRATRLERVTTQRGWSKEELTRRERRQMPLSEKRALSDYVIHNNSDLDSLRLSVERLFDDILTSYDP